MHYITLEMCLYLISINFIFIKNKQKLSYGITIYTISINDIVDYIK